MDLFQQEADAQSIKSTPLADRMRPKRLSDFFGQEHLIGENKIIRRAIENDELSSMIFWGPPGVGKTTLAKLIAGKTQSDFFLMSAVTAGVADIRKVLAKAQANRSLAKRSVLFIDEIHRFNKAQQDALLHSVEDGTILLIGATTENPSFEVNAPLLSRCRVYKLNQLDLAEIEKIVEHALTTDELLTKQKVTLDEQARRILFKMTGGDARNALNTLELSIRIAAKGSEGEVVVKGAAVKEALQTTATPYDKKGEYHYDIISAFIKSVRGSDPNAALYWLARMIEAGEDARFIARRLIILASEDIGNADPGALTMATSAFTAINYIGMPEGRIILSQAATYLACAPKSNASYKAIAAAQQDVKEHPVEQAPLHLRNAPTALMKSEGYGDGYIYPHDHEGSFVEQQYLPDNLRDRKYYRPTRNGAEKGILERLQSWWQKYRD